ncbi:MAG: hypothetical protein KBG20_20825 [Caldilineaceae bacterium]|nr:hypothetical protein [Caldilineaceae bacterium]MBP8109958.1 hypothetical protein [Caldilineaceae bacterium]MBP8124976.1 hypothetical protein [Caldilineaceae bacterium]MBP9074765.1 hypothetical protein [Caldilineaceae bacterium]
MTVEVTIRIPDILEKQMRRFQGRLPEILERGIYNLLVEEADPIRTMDELAVMEILASRPTSEEILALKPSNGLQTRVTDLLARSKESPLSQAEETELDRYLMLEHLVRLAKVKALSQIGTAA